MLDLQVIEEAVKKVNTHKNAIYRDYCFKNRIEFLDRFVIASKEDYAEEKHNQELAGVDNGVDEILADYELPQEVKALIKNRVGVVSLHHLVHNEAFDIKCAYENILNKPRYDYMEACNSIKWILEQAFGRKYPDLVDTMWRYNYPYEINGVYTRKDLMEKMGQVAIENMEKIDGVFKKYNITSLSGKAFMLQQLYTDALFHYDTARTSYEQYAKLI